jgi:site-specific DNA-methyltransferase (adenine-specific)
VEHNRLYQGDCIQGLSQVESESVNLAFADPPFNIGYEYDVYDDRSDADQYLDWTRKWGQQVHRVLAPTGTFWLAIGDEYAAELKLIFQKEIGFTCRSWVIWYYTFGVNCTKKFCRSHAHLFHFVKDRKRFTFNAMDPAVRVPSARQLVYADARGNPDGRLPDDTWILRPQDLHEGFQPGEDTWYFSRVCGTFKERAGWHGCQMPEQLLGRIIRVSSNPGDLVLDPFAGSGTTLVVAKKLGRNWIGFEMSPNYVAQAQARLDATRDGEPLEGPKEPKLSAPPTPAVPVRRRRSQTNGKADSPSLFDGQSQSKGG